MWNNDYICIKVEYFYINGPTIKPQMRPKMETQLRTEPTIVPISILVMVSCITLNIKLFRTACVCGT
jgi:hypothetical protein